jgi:uncharacterized coiled-coil protein SlyX
MKIVLLSLCLFAGAVATAKEHPIVKVIAMLEDLKGKAIAQGKEEQVAYEKFSYWCSTSQAELKDAIAEEKETISELEDTISGQKKEIETLTAKIEKLEEEIGALEASAKEAKEDRDAEAKLYAKVSKDLDDTIKAMGDCITALTEAETKTESMMLAQRRVKGLIALVSMKATEQQLQTLVSFATGKPKSKAEGDLAKHTDKYDFKSENVIELLKQLQLKFEDEKLEVTKAETNALNAYDLSKAARDNSIEAAKKSKEAKEKSKGATEKAKAQAEADFKSTNDDLTADSKSLSSTEESCATKASEWDERSKTRALEIEAMEQAIKILGKSTGVRTEAPGNPIPPASPVKFLQISQASRPVSDKKMKALNLLRSAAKDAHSRALEALAMEVSTHLNGPFDQVNNMIQKMVFRLMDEQKKEDEHKLWCDEEIKKTDTMKENKDDKIAELKAEIKEETAAVGKLTEEIAAAAKMISDITSFMKEATEIRNTGKKENELAIKDAQDAQTSVTNAIAVLEAFYKESGEVPKEPWEFIQKPLKLPKDPKTWDSSYTGVADPKNKGGIITILENINADFSKMEAETKSQEQVDQKEYEDSMKANEIEKAGRTRESEMKNAEKSRRSAKIADLNASKKDTSAELEKTEQYLEDLKPACVDGDSSYEDRKAARAKEIDSLKKAQVTLQDAFKEQKEGFLQIKPHF